MHETASENGRVALPAVSMHGFPPVASYLKLNQAPLHFSCATGVVAHFGPAQDNTRVRKQTCVILDPRGIYPGCLSLLDLRAHR